MPIIYEFRKRSGEEKKERRKKAKKKKIEEKGCQSMARVDYGKDDRREYEEEKNGWG